MDDGLTFEVVRDWYTQRTETDDELAIVNAQVKSLLCRQQQLRDKRIHLRQSIKLWNAKRTFDPFLRLPLEIREMIYDRYASKNKHFHALYAENIALACKQVREEYFNWLGWNRPMVLQMLFGILLRRPVPERPRSLWPEMPGQILERGRLLDIEVNDSYTVICRLNLTSGELKTILDDRPSRDNKPMLREEKESVQHRDEMDMYLDRVRVVGAMIAREGAGLRKEHVEFFYVALKDFRGATDPQAWEDRLVEVRAYLRRMEKMASLGVSPNAYWGIDDP